MSLFGRKAEEDFARGGENSGPETLGEAGTAETGAMSVKILGSGCAKCNQLEKAAREALGKLGMEDTIEHVTDFEKIAAYGVMSTPALVIDGKVASSGKVLKTEEVVKILQKARGK